MHKINLLLNSINKFGLLRGTYIILKILFIRNRNGEYNFYLKKGFNVCVRGNTTDWLTFLQVIINNEYKVDHDLDFPIEYILDAGANVGYSTIYFAMKYPNARIIAIEPDKDNYKQLIKNTKSVNNVIPLKVALWGKSESLQVFDPGFGSWGMRVEKSLHDSLEHIDGFTVNDLITKYNLPYFSLVKIDIEGSEMEIFDLSNNPHGWLSKVKLLMIELHPEIDGVVPTFFKGLSGLDFSIYPSKGETLHLIFKKKIKN
jgi:FkbM family methyltransferase